MYIIIRLKRGDLPIDDEPRNLTFSFHRETGDRAIIVSDLHDDAGGASWAGILTSGRSVLLLNHVCFSVCFLSGRRLNDLDVLWNGEKVGIEDGVLYLLVEDYNPRRGS